jgi:hypothetical protein
MNSAYFIIYPGKNPPPQNGCRLKSVFFFPFRKDRFYILHFLNSTELFTKPTGRHYTKYRFVPDIAPPLPVLPSIVVVVVVVVVDDEKFLLQ